MAAAASAPEATGPRTRTENLFAGSEGIYHLPHHAKEVDRLQRQSELILSSTQNVLITAPLKPGKVKVLDSGASDGSWLLDVARLYPNHDWSLHGVDIGSALFPPKTGRYAALDLREFNIKSATPPEPSWANSFDLVHQRLLVWGLQKDEWLPVVKNHFHLVKPGGWIQLAEVQWVPRGADYDALPPILKRITAFQQWTTEFFGMDVDAAYRLEDWIKEAGFVNVQKTSFTLGYGAAAREEAWQKPSAEMWLETFGGLRSKVPEGGIPGLLDSVDEFDKFLEEIVAGVLEYGYRPTLNFVIGQRPE
ncbi:uncharacterized protein C8A04DRAFT_30595 [Dichotomopilus funicola]|uniref:S-adenosyl-L-methionine-dependent methyltransferase n=1 Tax=Dichotomopilus funicola TaxID=1934379 RepID=A0AAN6V1D5_9PEZI|nr:hypothetical protein C8A04DRAFT_30595 [Dichotomopilus funicola]